MASKTARSCLESVFFSLLFVRASGSGIMERVALNAELQLSLSGTMTFLADKNA